ncbi:MAG: MFS transporter [Paracoccaceae bacterium]|nr:MFS transporter [Paracoccaceae bacterium]
MFAQALQSKLSKLEIYYGWVMVGIVFITSFCSAAVSSVPQIIIVPMTQEFGWNISDVSVATALMYLILAMLCPFGPALILKIGMKNVVLISVVLEILGLFFTVVSYEKWHLLFSIGVCLGVASGIIGLGLSSIVAVRWFNFKRGLVLGIMGSAFAAGSLLFLPLMAWITTSYNWKFAIVPGLVGMCICGLLCNCPA